MIMVALMAAISGSLTRSDTTRADNSPHDLVLRFTFPVNGFMGSKADRIFDPNPHDGVDLHAWGGAGVFSNVVGAPVFASYTGVVEQVPVDDADCTSGYGTHVRISHGGGWETRYAHLDSVVVAQNDKVTTGQLIGYQGVTGGSHCSPHVHFEILNFNYTPIWVDFNAQLTGLVPFFATTAWQNNQTDFTQAGRVTAQSPIGFNGTWWLRSQPSVGTAKVVVYGSPGDIPVMGDWNGDAYDTPGVVRYNVSTGHLDWLLYNTPALWQSSAPTLLGTQQVFGPYGDPGDTPVVGNWNGIVGDEFGVVRRAGGVSQWYLSGVTPFPFSLGLDEDTPVVGNWACWSNGRDGVGVARHSASVLTWFLSNLPDGSVEYTFNFGVGTGALAVDYPTGSRYSGTTPQCARPTIIRNGAQTWIYRNGVSGTGVSTTTLTAPVGLNDVGIPANWDVDSTDDAVVGS
jgi:hypothetical protein